MSPKQVLTPKQARFVEEYLVDLNATQAAIRARYSAKSAARIGVELLNKTHVAEAIAAAMAERSKRTEVTADRVLLELARIGFSDVMQHYEVDEFGRLSLAADAPDGASAAVSSIKRKTRTFTRDGDTEVTHEVEYKLWDKNTALASLGKHLGLFKEGAGLVDVSTWEEPEYLERVANGEDPYKVAADRMRFLASRRDAA